MSEDEIPNFVPFDAEPDKKLSKEYKATPSIENYLRLRKAHADKEIEVAVTGGIEWLFANEALVRDQGIDPQIIAGALDASHDAISTLSLTLLKMLSNREKLHQSGIAHITSRGEGISDAFANYLIAMMLDALSWNDNLEIPRDLIVLIRHQLLGSEKPLYDKKLESRQTRQAAVSIAAHCLERGDPISMRQIANLLKKNVSTISRMFPGGSLESDANRHLEGLRMVTGSQTPFADMVVERQVDPKK